MFRSYILRLNRLFKTDVGYVLRGGSFLAVAQIVSALVAFGLTIAFANLLPVETYGTYRYILSVYSLIAILAMPGIDTAVTQSASRGFDGSLKQGVSVKLRSGIIVSVISGGIAIYNLAYGHIILGFLFVVVAICAPFMEAATVYLSYLNGKKLFRAWAVTETITQITSALITVGVLLVTKNIIIIVSAYFIPVILIRNYFTRASNKLATNNNTDSDMIRYGRSMTVFQVITRGISSIDQIVLYHVMGSAEVAIFSLALAMPARIQSMFKIFGTIAMPKFATRDVGEVAASLPRKTFMLTLSVIATCIVYIVFAPILFKYVFPKYLPSLSYTKILIFYILSATTYPFSSLLLAHKKIRENYIISIASIIVKIAALAIFVPLYGIWGAVISVLGAAGTVIIASFFFLWKEIRKARTASFVLKQK